ncbi:hypothetical protein AQUCO_02600226v1 [Aquilegia coerulea]|uniref:Uncharacterized protein n=1 Tax=Aquilegia coerulea TaxID=218851 RepID=A0A2G5D7X5_AQUCA|nr:hypothetical protein AQUCO_02600226v1 [Aquilegia coerulea]
MIAPLWAYLILNYWILVPIPSAGLLMLLETQAHDLLHGLLLVCLLLNGCTHFQWNINSPGVELYRVCCVSSVFISSAFIQLGATTFGV